MKKKELFQGDTEALKRPTREGMDAVLVAVLLDDVLHVDGLDGACVHANAALDAEASTGNPATCLVSRDGHAIRPIDPVRGATEEAGTLPT